MNRYIIERYEGDTTEQSIHSFNDGDNFETLVTYRYYQLIDQHPNEFEFDLEFYDPNSEACIETDDFTYRWELVSEDKPFSELCKAA